MFKDTSELAENKLLLLYILDKLPNPVSNSDITQVVLENNLINYFSLQQYIFELIDNGFISDFKEDKTHKLTLTESGKNTLEFFINRIPVDKLETINKYTSSIKDVSENIVFNSSFEKENNQFKVTLKGMKNNTLFINLDLYKDSEIEALSICNNWNNNGETLYKNILDLLKNANIK